MAVVDDVDVSGVVPLVGASVVVLVASVDVDLVLGLKAKKT